METFLIIYYFKFINKNQFVKLILEKNVNNFVVDINSLAAKMTIHLAKKAEITLLLIQKINILSEYLNFNDVFLKNLQKFYLNLFQLINTILS